MPTAPFLRRLALLLTFSSAAAAQDGTWELLDDSPSSGRFEDGSFISPLHGWIVDGGGNTYRTTDGGASWTLRSEVDGYLRSAAFVSETTGWVGVLSSDTRLYETHDGGATMDDVTDRITPAIPGGICGLFAVDAQTVYGVGQWSAPAYVIKTADGGASWQSTLLDPSLARSLIDVYFFDAQRGLAVGGTNAVDGGGRAVVLATEDGGATWARRFVSSGAGTDTEWAWKISFPTPEVGYVSVEYEGSTTTGKVLKTTDGGQTWAEIAVPGGRSMQGVGFITPDLGWTSGRGTTTRTTNGGDTWAVLTSELDGSVNRFEFFGDTLGYAMGQRVYRLLRGSTTAAEPAAPPSAALLAVSPNPSAAAVAIAYRLDAPGPVEVAIHDALGRRVAVLEAGVRAAGLHEAVWNGEAPAGVYLARLTAGTRTESRPFVITRR